MNNGFQENRYGAIARSIQPITTGYIFIVKNSSDVDYTDITYEFPPYNGFTRVFSTLATAAASTVLGRFDVVICPQSLVTQAGLTALATDVRLIVDGCDASVGTMFFLKKTIVSSAITTAAQDLSLLAFGEVQLSGIILKTDATGLAGGTNFAITTNNTKGLAAVATETFANLGANRTVITPSVANNTTTTIENGKKLQFASTVANGTGSGTIDVYFSCRRVTPGAYLLNA